MEAQYVITVTKRIPRDEKELEKMYSDRHHNFNVQYTHPVEEFTEKNVLSTVLTENEFKNVRTEVLKNWETEKG